VKIVNVEFVTSTSTGAAGGFVRDDVAQFAFTGRSNVGKSSLLNALAGRKIAHTSAAAGKTRLTNTFRITAKDGPGGPGTWSCYLVDLPGYGYARGGDESATELAAVAHTYFKSSQREDARGAIFLLVDSRHPGLDADLQAQRWLSEVVGPPQIVATKVDKLSRKERTTNLRQLGQLFGTAVQPVSATNGEGLDELWKFIARRARSGRA
jgi:GTP-binding protein